jgi:hypothetical protein
MGLFDFLRRPASSESASEKRAAETTNTPSDDKSDGKYYGDLEKTEMLAQLFATPHDQRDEAWVATFFANAGQASFCCEAPQVITGPDSFPYVRLTLPESNKPFTCYVIEHMIPQFVLRQGLGIAINPDKAQPDWVFSYGDLVNYHLYGAFDARDTRFEAGVPEQETLTEGTLIKTGEPSPQILPPEVRQTLRGFLERVGIPAKVMLMSRDADAKGNRKGGLSLVFPFTRDSFNNPDEYAYFVESLGWFFPRHYSVLGMADSEHFFEL